MKYTRFEELPVWQAATALCHGLFDACDDRGFAGLGDLRNQLQRAALSISNNVAEGFERGTTNELISYLYIARGSAGEVRSALIFARDRPGLRHLNSEISNLMSRAENVSRQLAGWAQSLQNSPIEGVRGMTDQSKADYHQKHRAAEFLAKLQAMRDQHLPPREPDAQ